MMILDTFKLLLLKLNFIESVESDYIFIKNFNNNPNAYLKVDFKTEQLIYPTDKGFKVNGEFTCNFKSNENFVVFECIHRLFEKGYQPQHIELEPKWQLGHGASGGRADIWVKNHDNKSYLLIECKTYGGEFEKAKNDTLSYGGQLFSYIEQEKATEFVALYACDYDVKNNHIITQHMLISHQDNLIFLQENPQLHSFEKASNFIERYDVWKNTYQLEYATSGIFEDSVSSYAIGKSNQTIFDLQTVDGNVGKKYHEFATILRQHNVSGRENAFDKLVNLFLCKIVDEQTNPNHLQFVWKGIGQDNHFALQDRLQKLYQEGMKQFLNEEVTYIESEAIDKAFRHYKRASTKNIINQYIKELKFFSNNDFAFINVHNEKLFYQNSQVLLKMVNMLKDIRLTGDNNENQFLGDLFEGFLDSGVKQSEGQFFTPMPIVKFIMNSLPIEQQIKVSTTPIKVIDYACGSGHFLTEIAKEIAKTIKDTHQLKDFYKHIHGIEKEYRLSKVAKVSAFMYGQNETQIFYTDALAKNSEIKENSYDILVANPPYSVSGFLSTLDKQDQIRYELFNEVNDIPKNKNIECFFIELTHKLLKSGGIAALVLPSSILSNDGLYIKAREIFIKYFYIIGIVELPSATFGKTGTNTVVVYLKKRQANPYDFEHFQDRVLSWFEEINYTQANNKPDDDFEDIALLKKYCQHINIAFNVYQSFMRNELPDEWLQNEIFADYKKAFEKSTEYKNIQKKRTHTSFSVDDKDKETHKKLLQFITTLEQEKILYFILAQTNQVPVLVCKAPSDTKKQKQFLGYEWSNRKGNEGIQYLSNNSQSSNPSSAADDVDDEMDTLIFEQKKNLSNINTPLYNPKNKLDNSKINYLIHANFINPKNKTTPIPTELSELCEYVPLVNMLDFSRATFNKAISLTPKENTTVETKWELVKIEDLCDIGRGKVINHQYIAENQGDYPVYSSQTQNNGVMGYINTFDFEGEYVTWTTDGIYAGTCFYRENKFNCTNVCGTLKVKNKKLLIKFLPLVLNDITPHHVVKSANPKLMNNVMANIKIPLPPLAIQEEIVAKCEAIYKNVESAKAKIETAKGAIEQIILTTSQSDYPIKKLGGICSMQAGKFVTASEIKDDKEGKYIYPCYGGNGLRGYTQTFTHEGEYSLIGRQGALCGNINKAKEKFHATEHAIVVTPKEDINFIWLYHQLKTLNLNQYATGSAQPGLSVQKLLTITTYLPPIETQKTIIAEIEVLEQTINENKTIINAASSQKQAIIKSYL
jgi:type I restriction-modification system DNA methylase subunit/restriction endonuclease S subunit